MRQLTYSPTTQAGREVLHPRKQRTPLPFLTKVDGRTLISRRLRALLSALSADVVRGHGRVTAAQRMLIERAAFLTLQCQAAETDAAFGRDVDLTLYITAVNALRRTLLALGLPDRQPEPPSAPAEPQQPASPVAALLRKHAAANGA
jgi:hypothetical protein